MQIGDFARKAGLSVRAVRYYEELGLLRPEAHSGGGFRLYGEENLKRIRVINFLKDLGLTLTEIRQLLQAKKASGASKETVRYLAEALREKLAVVEGRLEMLQRMRAELTRAISILRNCDSCDQDVLLDAVACRDCERLKPRDSVPETFEVLLQ